MRSSRSAHAARCDDAGQRASPEDDRLAKQYTASRVRTYSRPLASAGVALISSRRSFCARISHWPPDLSTVIFPSRLATYTRPSAATGDA